MVKIIVAIVVIAAIIGGFFAVHKSSNGGLYSNSANNTAQSPPQNSQSANTSTQSAAATITFDGNGFSPQKVTVKSGDSVAIKNISSQTMQFDSDPHPIHTDDTDLNAGVVNPGQTISFTVHKTGTFGYHDHLDPSLTGTIVIQ
ncbi:MAG TPA: cupredoxin domain-containing protein [Candidatus Saccharimonadales bacterium]|nr:cupredoxin domain-containing protein [Candidatus Saccharimonadales bacterium]